ncbi:MAG: hypothetical protein DMD81_07740 [Candidatus Rokuibacteriota bacterium]|nr:MAG: hypothetical protein DMD81_07740 [Candidatus Rokubacteria bacterium]
MSAAFPIPGRLNLALASIVAAALLSILAAAGQLGFWWCALVLAPAWGVLMNTAYALIHEAEHNLFHADRRVNDGAGVLLALFFPAPFHLLRQGHLGHHLRNRSDDEAFDLYFVEDHAVWKWSQFYGILAGFYWAVVAFSNVVAVLWPSLLRRNRLRFDRPTAALLDSLDPRSERLIRIEAAAAVVFHVALAWFFGVAPTMYLVVLCGFGLSWSGLQYVHHFDTVRDVRWGARNLRTWSWLDRIWLHHNYHLNHHLDPTVPWRYLPSLFRGIEYERGSLLRAYLRMWRGPRLTTIRVENRYAGVVVR